MASHSQSISKISHSRIVDRSPVFYGWVVWFVAMIGMIGTSPGQSFSVSLFIDHYITEFPAEKQGARNGNEVGGDQCQARGG